jgi:hypothetical protein
MAPSGKRADERENEDNDEDSTEHRYLASISSCSERSRAGAVPRTLRERQRIHVRAAEQWIRLAEDARRLERNAPAETLWQNCDRSMTRISDGEEITQRRH